MDNSPVMPQTNQEIRKYIRNTEPPSNYIISSLKWKHLVRSVLRGKNVMFTGHSGCGKTEGAYQVSKLLGRDLVRFNVGSMQDPRTALIGTREAEDGSTTFKPSEFVKAIQREDGPVILLDELTRGTHEAWNILMTVLDEKQRYLRLDEGGGDDSVPEKIEVHPSVSFVATANMGSIYTATRVIDRAVQDRFTFIETDLLNADQEYDLLKKKVSEVDKDILFQIAKIADNTRSMAKDSNSVVSRLVSTRQSLEMAALIRDGFSLYDAAELIVFPMYPEDEHDGERGTIRKVIERFEDARVGEDVEDLFTSEDMKNAI